MRVYLAGQITGLTFGQATDWRQYAKTLFPSSVEVLSPLRAKDFLLDKGTIKSGAYDEHVLATAKGIVTRDRFDTRTSDVLLMNLMGMETNSIGCMIELGWADAWRVPVVLIAEEGNPHREHAMVHEIVSYITESVEQAAEVACAVLGAHALEGWQERELDRAIEALPRA